MEHLLSAAFLSELFDDQVVYFLVELDNMVSVKVVVDMSKGDLRVLGTDFDLYGVLLSKEMELLQSPLEVLDLTKDQS